MNVPTTIDEWKEEVSDRAIYEESIHSLGSYVSASEITENQFLLLRVIWSGNSQAIFSENHEY